MTPLLKTLYHAIKHISTIVTSSLFLIGSILFILPIYHFFFTISDEKNLKKLLYACLHQLGLINLISPYDANNLYYTTSVLSSVDDNVTCELNLPIDTQVCLLPERSSAMVAGLVNTGNSCFLNSVLQSLSSLPKLQIYLDQLNSAHSTSKIPVTQSLLKTLRLLSKPSEGTFQPIEIVKVLKQNHQVINREQQDAQELYQLLINDLETETSKLSQKRGFQDTSSFGAPDKIDACMIDNPLTGSIAYQTACMQCGYTSGIPMHSFNNVQLTLPAADVTTLDECLKQLTCVEYLNDVECSKCSLIKTVQTLGVEIELLQGTRNNTERLQHLQTAKKEIEHRLETGVIEQNNSGDLQGMISKSVSVKSKQGMFAKPPKVLCLHFVRSIYLPSGDVMKNTCQVQYPEVLDLAPYCTDGTLKTRSTSTPDHDVSSIKYRLMSSVVHYGSHNSGHYIAYKRRLLADHCGCDYCGHDDTKLKSHDSEWFKISDDKVMACEADDALRENPFMLLYELVEQEDIAPKLDLAPAVIPRIDSQVWHQQQQDYFWQGSESEEEDLEDWLALNVPAAPPSSPIMEPSSTYTKKPIKKNVGGNKRHAMSHLDFTPHSIPILTQ